jgi:FtsP/CotA-like multicopper oxidase with cupredoxin domain
LLDLGVAVGEVLSITLDNGLAENVALAFPGQQPLVPDTIGATPGGTKTYMVTMSRPGTFLYEAGGPNAPRQVAMGLYGALVVPSGTAGQAYGTAASAYDSQAVLVLGEIDPVLNGVLPDPPNGAFDMNNYAPKYFLINGQAYDDTAEIEALAGDRVLLRYVNGALSHHTMELLGLHQREIAEDAYPLDDPLDLVSETFPTGTTGDMIVTVPASATVGTSFPLFSRNLNVTNDGTFPGGMLTYISVVSGP